MFQLNYQSFSFPFERPFGISKGIKTHQDSLLIALRMGPLLGLGEATAIKYYDVNVEEMTKLLEKHRSVIERYALVSPERFWHFLHHLIPGHNFLISALDCAAWDIWGQMKRQPVWQLLGYQWHAGLPPTDYTIGLIDPSEVADWVARKPFPVYKLKLGGESDIATLEALRSATPAVIRIDANEGWSLDVAKEIYPYLEQCRVELIEQPFHRDDIESLSALKSFCKIPIIADEACREEKDLDKALELYDGINIKLSKCGGITPAVRMIKRIKEAGKTVMLGSMSENVVGCTALAQLLPAADYADIDGPLLLGEHYGKGLVYRNATIELPQRPGLGLTF